MRDLAAQGKTALVSFITAGDPQIEATVPAMHALVSGGVDVLELGVPFSDPEAEGPAIQRSSERALANGVRLHDVLAMVSEFRADDDTTPVVLMGYLNTVLRIGPSEFARLASASGVDAIIMVNLPPEESAEIGKALADNEMDLVLLVAPTTTMERAALVVSAASGFVYYVSLKGVTGADHLQADSIADSVRAVKGLTDLPVMVGFGIKDASTARAVSQFADGVVVGSALVNTMADLAAEPARIPDALIEQARDLRRALDG